MEGDCCYISCCAVYLKKKRITGQKLAALDSYMFLLSFCRLSFVSVAASSGNVLGKSVWSFFVCACVLHLVLLVKPRFICMPIFTYRTDVCFLVFALFA